MGISLCAGGCGATVGAGSKTGRCRACNLRALNADPEFAERHRERGRERMRALHADPEFAERHRERMRALNADPEFAERHRERSRERMRALHADPEFAERHRERMRERMRALNADPARNPLAGLSAEERADYDLLRRKGGLSRAAALRAMGLDDLAARVEVGAGGSRRVADRRKPDASAGGSRSDLHETDVAG